MLTEDQVVEAVTAHLRSAGWHILRTSTVKDGGLDKPLFEEEKSPRRQV
jgi:hypothetical protein